MGDLIAALKEQGKYENTLVIFSSDNGPTYTGGADTPFFDSAKPFKTTYGWGKGFVHEGGIRVPMIAAWPGKIPPDSESEHISSFYDLMPTLCDITGQSIPVASDGISFLPAMLEQDQKVHEFLYWEFPAYQGQQAVRMGKWKGIRKGVLKDQLAIALYDLEQDPQETINLADSFPAVVEQIATIFEREHVPATIERFKMKALGD